MESRLRAISLEWRRRWASYGESSNVSTNPTPTTLLSKQASRGLGSLPPGSRSRQSLSPAVCSKSPLCHSLQRGHSSVLRAEGTEGGENLVLFRVLLLPHWEDGSK